MRFGAAALRSRYVADLGARLAGNQFAQQFQDHAAGPQAQNPSVGVTTAPAESDPAGAALRGEGMGFAAEADRELVGSCVRPPHRLPGLLPAGGEKEAGRIAGRQSQEGSAETVALPNNAMLLLKLLNAHFGKNSADTLVRALVALAEQTGIGSLIRTIDDGQAESESAGNRGHENYTAADLREEIA